MNLDDRKILGVMICALVLCAALIAVFLSQPRLIHATSSAPQAEINCSYFSYLPLVVRVSTTLSRLVPAATSAPSDFDLGLPCLDPGPVTGRLVDPDQDVDPPVNPRGGICPNGSHPVYANGWPNFMEEDDEGLLFDDAEYTCQPDQTLADAQCTAHGEPALIGGLAACQCEEGYAGAACDVCALGYRFDGDTQSCLPFSPPPEPNVLGIEDSVEVGAQARFQAQDPQGSPIESTWSLGTPPVNSPDSPVIDFQVDGCLFEIGGDGSCKETVDGTQVGYLAPTGLTGDAEVHTVQLNINPFGNPQFGLATKTIVIVGAGGIPITGNGDPRMQPLLDAVSRYMRQRCIGASMLGVARYGFPLAVYGFGREDGRAAASWHDYCGDDEGEPLANPTTNTTPLRTGSANKPITFATLRWVINEKLKDDDTDLDIAALSSGRAVTAQRNLDGDVKLIVWDVAGDGTLTQLDSDIYDSGQVNGIETQVRDLSLIALSDEYVVLGTRNTMVPKLNVWSVAQNGDLTHVASLAIGTLVDLKLVSLIDNIVSTDRFAAAVRDKNGALDVRVYKLVSGNQIDLLDSYEITDATARDLALTDVSESTFSRLVVGNRDGDRHIVLRTFDIAANGALSLADQGQTSPVGEGLTLASLTPNQIVAAVRKVDQEDRLWLTSWSVSGSGDLQLQHTKLGDPVIDLSLASLGGSRVIVANRLASNGNLQMQTYDVAGDGTFTFLDDDGGGGLSGIALKSLTSQMAIVALRNASNNLENIVWDIAVDGTLDRLDEATGEKVPDSIWSESDVEDLNLVGFDLPELLVPDRVHAILRGDLLPPVYVHTDACDDLVDFADPQWQSVKIGHILRHATGLPKSAPDFDVAIQNYELLRGLNSEPDYASQEQILRDEFSNATVDNGKNLLGYGGQTIYVLPEPSLEEIFVLVGGRCLPYPLGESHYSNTSASLSGLIIQHLAGRFAAITGYPASHNGSALDLFFDYQLGVQTSGDSGIFSSQRVYGLPGYSFPETAYRLWSNSGTYYPTYYDDKRPHCVWDGITCTFDDWFSGSHGILRWLWDSVDRVPFEFEAIDTATGAAGNLAIEPGVFLNFMRSYWVNSVSGDSNPSIGEKRDNVWDSFRTHNGSAGGTKARVIQFGQTGNPYSLDFKLPRKYNSPYIPVIPEDTFGSTEPAFFIAKAGGVTAGNISTLLSSGQLAGLTDVGYNAGDLLAVGSNRFQNKPDSFYIARPNTGMIDIYKPSSADVFSFNGEFAAGDEFVVDDIAQSTTIDEVIIGDVSNGEVRIYNSPPISINGTAIPLDTYNLNFSPGDKLGVGDANGNGTNELFIARDLSGDIDIYGADGVYWMSLDADYSAADGFAVGDVIGTANRDDIIIGRAVGHDIDVYTFASGAYQIYTSFNGLYTADSDISVNDLGYGVHLSEIMVGVPGYGLAVVFKAQKIGADYQFFLQDFYSLNATFAPGDQVAIGFWNGLHPYRCSFGYYGSRQSDYPDGVDVVFSINTSSDKQCTGSGDCSDYFAGVRDNMLLYGICEIDWSDVIP